MALIKRSRYWHIKDRFFKNGQQLSIATNETNKARAAQIEQELLYACRNNDYIRLSHEARLVLIKLFLNRKWEIPAELVPPEFKTQIEPTKQPSQVLTLWEAQALFRDYPDIQIAKARERYRMCLVHIIDFFGKEMPLVSIGIPGIKDYRKARLDQGASPSTVNWEVGTLSRVFGVMQELEHVSQNPCRSVKSLSQKTGEREAYIGHSDFQAMLTRVSGWFRPIVKAAYYTGMRRGEIVDLKRNQINLERRMIIIAPPGTKEKNWKRIPISRDFHQLLVEIISVPILRCDYVFTIDGRKTNPESFKRQWKNAVVGMNPVPRFHDLRHTFRTNMRNSGVDPEITERIMGHSEGVKTVKERYGRILDHELIQAIDKLRFDFGPTVILTAK
ncbi:MAG: tyrosine-type recombinase/integrase [Desulfomonilaceae bacterium]